MKEQEIRQFVFNGMLLYDSLLNLEKKQGISVFESGDLKKN